MHITVQEENYCWYIIKNQNLKQKVITKVTFDIVWQDRFRTEGAFEA